MLAVPTWKMEDLGWWMEMMTLRPALARSRRADTTDCACNKRYRHDTTHTKTGTRDGRPPVRCVPGCGCVQWYVVGGTWKESSPEVGSSRNMQLGLPISSTAIITR